MTLDDALLWMFLLFAVAGYAVADRFDLHDYSKRWPQTIWAPMTHANRSAYALYWTLSASALTAIALRIFL